MHSSSHYPPIHLPVYSSPSPLFGLLLKDEYHGGHSFGDTQKCQSLSSEGTQGLDQENAPSMASVFPDTPTTQLLLCAGEDASS